jgi:hypothetical protein
MYVEGVGQKSGPCTTTFNDLFCFLCVYGETVFLKHKQWKYSDSIHKMISDSFWVRWSTQPYRSARTSISPYPSSHCQKFVVVVSHVSNNFCSTLKRAIGAFQETHECWLGWEMFISFFNLEARKDIAMKYNMFTFQFILGILFLAMENTHLKFLWSYEGWERQDVLLYMREINSYKNCEWRTWNKQSSRCKWKIRSHNMCGYRWGLDWRLSLLTLKHTTCKYK